MERSRFLCILGLGPRKRTSTYASYNEAMNAEPTMTNPTFDPSNSDTPRQGPGREAGRDQRQPFDNSGLDQIPQPRSDDPPYRDWWVVDTLDSKARRK